VFAGMMYTIQYKDEVIALDDNASPSDPFIFHLEHEYHSIEEKISGHRLFYNFRNFIDYIRSLNDLEEKEQIYPDGNLYFVVSGRCLSEDEMSNLFFDIKTSSLIKNEEFKDIKLSINFAKEIKLKYMKMYIPIDRKSIVEYYDSIEDPNKYTKKYFKSADYIRYGIENNVKSITDILDLFVSIKNKNKILKNVNLKEFKKISMDKYWSDDPADGWNIKFGPNEYIDDCVNINFSIKKEDIGNISIRKIKNNLMDNICEIYNLYPYVIVIDDNDDCSYSKYFLTEEEMMKEVELLYLAQPINIFTMIRPRGYLFTN
jgi:hypothetical protein